MPEIKPLHLQNNPYISWDELHLLLEQQYRRVVVVCDTNTLRHCLPIVEEKLQCKFNFVYTIPEGENSKSLETCQSFFDFALKNTLQKDDVLIALGGGVVLDIAGLCAALWKRGVDYISIPTSLLAMADASIGGKTAVNYGEIKNIIGCFNSPKAILVDLDFLKSLPVRHLRNGYVEMIKHCFLYSSNPATLLEPCGEVPVEESLFQLLEESIIFKYNIIIKDPFDQSVRRILNLGHSIGHAIESYLLKKSEDILHGEAIAVGLWIEGLWSAEKFQWNSLDRDTLTLILRDFFPKLSDWDWDWHQIIELMDQDKKNRDSVLQFSLLKSWGEPLWNQAINKSELLKFLQGCRIPVKFAS